MQARLRAQLGDRSKYSGERRRRSVVVVSIVFTITDPLRGSASLVQSPSCAHSLLRSFIRLHGVNHNQPFPTAIILHKIFTTFTILIVFQCFRLWHVSKALTHCRLAIKTNQRIHRKCHKGTSATVRSNGEFSTLGNLYHFAKYL